VSLPEQRFEYDRLGKLGWPMYTGDTFYADNAMLQVNMYNASGNPAAVYAHIMALPDSLRGMEYSNFESINWASTPNTSDSSTFWAYWGYSMSGSSEIYNRIMRTDEQYRGLAFAYLQRMNWSDYGGGNTFWADEVW